MSIVNRDGTPHPPPGAARRANHGTPVSPSAPSIIANVTGLAAISLKTTASDLGLQFLSGASQSIADFSFGGLTGYHPITGAFGVDPIGIPNIPGPIYLAAQAYGPAAETLQIQSEPQPAYGGSKKMLTWADRTVSGGQFVNLPTPIASDDVDNCSLVVRCRKSGIGANTATIAMLCAAQTGTITPALRISQSAAQAIIGVSTNAAGANTTVTGGTWPDNEWGIVAVVYDFTANTVRLIYWFDSTGLVQGDSATTSNINTRALATLLLGAQAAAGNNASFWQGQLDKWMVTRSKLTNHEVAYMGTNGAAPFIDCVFDPSKVVDWGELRSQSPKRSWGSNRLLANGTGYAGGVAVADSTAPAQAFVNSWAPMNSTNVKQFVYTDVKFTAAHCAPMTPHRTQAHHLLRADVATAPNPDAAGFSDIIAGVTVAGINRPDNLSAKNDSGVSTDTGTLNAVGLQHVQREGFPEYFLLTGWNAAGTQQSQVDFEFLYFGEDSIVTGWRDPFAPAKLRMIWLNGTKVWIGDLDPITGEWLDPNTHGENYDVGTWDTIAHMVKAPHTCCWANDWFVGGVINTAGPDVGGDPTYASMTRTGGGDPNVFTKHTIVNSNILNPLFIQNKDAPELAWSGALVGGNISYGRADGVVRSVPNCLSSDPDTGFRFPRKANFLLTTVTQGGNRGLPQITDVFTDVTTVLSIDGWNLGVDFAFDPQGWYAPEFGGRFAIAAQLADRKTLRVYKPKGPNISDGFEFHKDIAIDPAIVSASTGFLFSQSPEPMPIALKSTTVFVQVIKDSPVNDATRSIITCTRTFLQFSDTTLGTLPRRMDSNTPIAAPLDRVFNEPEFTMLGPDAGGRYQPGMYTNTKLADLANTVPSVIIGCRTAVFF